MNALILGGQSPRHEQWVRQVADAVRSDFDDVRHLDYRHWQTGQDDIDLEHEISQAAALADGLGEYIVVAKSIGSVITTLANAHGNLSPRRCIFMGFPLAVVQRSLPDVAEALPKLPPVVFLHNENDPLGSAQEVRSYIEAHAPASFELRTLPGDTHDYVDFDLIAQLAK